MGLRCGNGDCDMHHAELGELGDGMGELTVEDDVITHHGVDGPLDLSGVARP